MFWRCCLTDDTKIRGRSTRAQVKQKISQWIRDQELQPGDRVMPQARLAEFLRASPVTVHHALTELSREGRVVRRKGSGTFIAPRSEAVGAKQMCLVLPEAYLDEPRHNPQFWPHVQTMLRAFVEAGGSEWSFSTRTIPQHADSPALEAEFRRYDAAFFHFDRSPLKLIRRLVEAAACPVVQFGHRDDAPPCLSVVPRQAGGVDVGVSHLFECGYRRIALLHEDSPTGERSRMGYERAHAAYGLDVVPQRVLPTGSERGEGHRGAALLDSRGVDFDAVFVDDDARAAAAVELLRQSGRAIPADVGVMSHGGSDLAVYGSPQLTVVRAPYRDMIRSALDVVRQTKACPLPERRIAFTGSVVQGATTRPARGV